MSLGLGEEKSSQGLVSISCPHVLLPHRDMSRTTRDLRLTVTHGIGSRAGQAGGMLPSV